MRIRILGCGGAPGLPSVSRGWGVCDPNNPKNRRRRSSILVEQCDVRLLIDTSPDLREQLLDAGVTKLSAVLYTHDHADHVHGIDELREVNRATGQPLAVYGAPRTLETIQRRFDYVFGGPIDPQNKPIYRPMLQAVPVTDSFSIEGMEIIPFDQDHGYTISTGYRFGKFAYSTDVVDFPESSFARLKNLDLWIVGCLLDTPHETHAHLDKVLAWVDELAPKRTILTHMGSRMDYDSLKAKLPPNIEPAYDGMILEV